MQVLTNLRRTDFRRPWQIDDINAFFFQKIKLPRPVIAHDERIDMILMHFAPLLLPVAFWNDDVYITDGLQAAASAGHN